MSYVIIDKCLGERYATCVAVCPVDCIHPGDYKGEQFMIIDPEECIDCGACLPECPVGAIVESEEQSPDWAEFNRQAAAIWPSAHDEPAGWEARDPSEAPRRRD